ncbi:MAG: alpha-hydroxy-acid oxidizing protein [Marmoricola sp.]|nr:alpha-hydroxy-acid oxidizing protein [Marmoricola sp.]
MGAGGTAARDGEHVLGGTLRWTQEVRERSRAALPASVHRYVEEGAGEELTTAEAAGAWRRHRLWPRVLRDVTAVDTTTRLLGHTHASPLGIAPMTLQRAAHPDGEVAMARAAHRSGVPLVLSSNAGSTFADVGATGVSWWLQLYLGRDRLEAHELVARAVGEGAGAVVLTVDTPVVATRHGRPGASRVWDEVDPAWIGGNVAFAGVGPAARPKATDLGAADVTALAERAGVPVVVKGVLRGDDARVAVDAGASAVWVSNHGGRQLDRAVATAEALPWVSRAVGDDAEVYVDGGVRSGLDVVVALALGADAVFWGRPAFHALAAGGPEEVERGLALLGEELVEALRLAGCARPQEARGLLQAGEAGPPAPRPA